ncbi:fibronectin type III domain-containing protein [Paenibacillus mucilaginosus]|uniref:Carbohydrate-binding family 9 n=2 Tax=Paenibacillus mucilaginosus TaxID=61624 RepID=F8FKG2_PAEMK|nr:fibronectin type III domain-containing protein [Paenibacillus mucilaginosus]AEI45555.1 Carbohydrate-binding family 9 [Paenibacillus mucilaginosus KNP414]WDM26968.1 carbohydrate-binding protein [Paenibacillus mucilaginosus]
MAIQLFEGMMNWMKPYRRLLFTICCLFLMMLVPLSASAEEHTVTVSKLSAEIPSNDKLVVRVGDIDFSVELKEVVMEVEGRTAIMYPHCILSTRCYWEGELSLSGLSKGQKTVKVTAVDYFGNKGEAELMFQHDHYPVLKTQLPANLSVVKSPLHIKASASDDLGAPKVRISVSSQGKGIYNSTGAGSLDKWILLSDYDGQLLDITVTAEDSSGRQVKESSQFYTHNSEHAVKVGQVEGELLDFDAVHYLYLTPQKELKLKNRAGGGETLIHTAGANQLFHSASLQYGQVIFTVKDKDSSYDGPTYLWKDGEVTQIGSVQWRGSYMMYYDSGKLLVKHRVTGETREIVSGYPHLPSVLKAELTPEGDVWFSTYYGFGRSKADGSITHIHTGQGSGIEAFQVDGVIVLIYFSGGASKYDVKSGQQTSLSYGLSETDFEKMAVTRGGWTAYLKATRVSHEQVVLQSPQGEDRQLTYTLGETKRIQGLGVNGALFYSVNGKTFYYTPGSDKPVLEFASMKKLVQRDGTWYGLLGNTLFKIRTGEPADTQAPEWPAGSALTVTDVTYSTAKLAWRPASDNVGVAKYILLQNGARTAELPVTAATYGVSGLQPGTAYTFSLAAEDAAGNRSTANPSVSFTTGQEPEPEDTAAPEWPSGEAVTVSGVTYAEAELRWVPASDLKGVTAYEIYRNEELLDTVSGAVYSYRASGLSPETVYVFTLKARDAAGNVSLNNPSVTVTTSAYGPEPGPAGLLGLQAKKGMVEAGSVLEVTVKAEGAQDLYGFLAKLEYDPSRLKLMQTGLHPDFGREQENAVFGRVASAAGRAKLTGSLLGDVPGRSGRANLITLKFTALKAGESEIRLLADSAVSNSQGVVTPRGTAVVLKVNVGAGDFDGDGRVGLSDLVRISGHYGQTAEQAGYEPQFDLNRDGRIDRTDIQYVADKTAAAG